MAAYRLVYDSCHLQAESLTECHLNVCVCVCVCACVRAYMCVCVSPTGWLPRTGISSGTIRSAVEYGLPYTHTRLTALCPGLPGWAGTRTNLDFTEARDSEWQWHQLGHMQVCTLFQTDNRASTPPLNFYRPDALPAAQPTASEHWRPKHWRPKSTEGRSTGLPYLFLNPQVCLPCRVTSIWYWRWLVRTAVLWTSRSRRKLRWESWWKLTAKEWYNQASQSGYRLSGYHLPGPV